MLTILAAAAAAAFMQPSPAADAPQPVAEATHEPAIDPERLAGARALIAIFNNEAAFSRQSAVFAEFTANAAIAAAEGAYGETISPAVADRIHRAAREDSDAMFNQLRPAIEREIAEAYARQFTKGELERLAVLMGDPLLQRMQELSPEITREALAASVVEAVEMAATPNRMERAIEEWMESLSERPAPSS